MPALPAETTAVAADPTRERLLAAAGAVFADRGFRAATVREICTRADANIAAVNYHFGNKENLYTEVLRSWILRRQEIHPLLEGASENAPAEVRLRAFVHSMLRRLFGPEGAPAWFSRLIAREMAEPTHALDRLVAEIFRPQLALIEGIVREVLGPRAGAAEVRRAAWSVAGQWVIYHCGQHLMDRIGPAPAWTPAAIEALADHITAFSIAGLRGLAAARAARRSPS